MRGARTWMQVVGAFYVLQFAAMALVRAPIRAVLSPDALDAAAAGDPTARFLIDTWVTFGLEVLAIGVGLLVASRDAARARALIWTVLAIEVSRGIVADIYQLVRGNDPAVLGTWLVIHTVIIVTGLRCLRDSRVHGPTAIEPQRTT